ncbi:hypothetical protein NU688_26660 [Variovorax sp. ZS18.2.2]|uniref:hypothetical protein n=1 Tax=Variovorax sp. ZS18.2.2 TaxID=2971255 RepID=UPI0021507D6A|nr:hypothetical protein [Variovorax sp. ZS18.2.2]MCR6479766.1 hypothetical protein [Variovorax sp. ZS18.2.2]
MAKKKSINGATSASATAEPNTPAQQPLPQEKDFLDTDRREVICIAACESLDWLAILQALSGSTTFDPETLARRLPGILNKLAELSSIVLSAIDDPRHQTAALRQSLSPAGAT